MRHSDKGKGPDSSSADTHLTNIGEYVLSFQNSEGSRFHRQVLWTHTRTEKASYLSKPQNKSPPTVAAKNCKQIPSHCFSILLPFSLTSSPCVPWVRTLFWAHPSGCCEGKMLYQAQWDRCRAWDLGSHATGFITIPNTGSVLRGPALVRPLWSHVVPPSAWSFRATSLLSTSLPVLLFPPTPALRVGQEWVTNTLSGPPGPHL